MICHLLENFCLWIIVWILRAGFASSATEEERRTGLAAFRSVGQQTKDRALGTANAPIHVVTAGSGQFKEHLWKTFRSIALTFLVISGIGALIEDKGISKGLLLCSRLTLCCSWSSFRSNSHWNLGYIQDLVWMKRFGLPWIRAQSSVMSRELMKLKLNLRKSFTTYEIPRFLLLVWHYYFSAMR